MNAVPGMKPGEVWSVPWGDTLRCEVCGEKMARRQDGDLAYTFRCLNATCGAEWVQHGPNQTRVK